jgi:lysophospholipase L1-like esterase
MSLRNPVVLALTLVAGLASAALAAPPPPDDPGGSGDPDKNHVHRLKPWKAKFRYKMMRDAVAHYELNKRSDLQAQVLKGQWWQIDCQLYNRTQDGRTLWNHIANVGWVPDEAMRTFTTGRLQGSPKCDKPGANHVWFKQRWTWHKEYRLKYRVPARDRPGGAPVAKVFEAGEWTTTNCHGRHGGRQWVFIDFKALGAGWVPADALNFWQKGLPARMPRCVRSPKPLRTWVAMGDSYASGQGANEYFGGDCRRSWHSYWSLLRGRLRHGITSPEENFVACSGATTADVRAHQLSALDPTTRLVTLSVGGNDVGFASALESCYYPKGDSCKDAVSGHFQRRDLRRLRANLKRVYRRIRDRATNARVLVLGYPWLVSPDHVDGCSAMSVDDAPYLNRAARKLNSSIRRAVGKRRGFRFVGLVDTFRDHPACSSSTEDWINNYHETDSDESFHPNEAGHRAIAERLARVAPRFFR